MNGLLQWIGRLNLALAFLVLFALHGLLYFGLGNGNWLFLSLSAALVWTAVLALVQLFARRRGRSR